MHSSSAKALDRLLRPAGLLLLFAAWWLLSESGLVGKTLIATPSEVLEVTLRTWSAPSPDSHGLKEHLSETLENALLGWTLAGVAGVLAGYLVGRSWVTFKLSDSTLEFVRAIPPVLAFPLFLVAFDFGRSAYVGTIVFGCFPIAVIAVAQGIRAIDRERIEIFRIHRSSETVRALIGFMEILPVILLAARITFSFALIIAVVTEMVFAPRSGLGIGSVAKDAEIAFDTPLFFSAVLLIGLIGYLINLILSWIESWLKPSTKAKSAQVHPQPAAG